jgi:hypothetical protein
MPHRHCFPQVYIPPTCTIQPALDGSVYLPPFYHRGPIAASLLVQPGTASVITRPGCPPQITTTAPMVTPVLPNCCQRPFGGAQLLAPGQCGVRSGCCGGAGFGGALPQQAFLGAGGCASGACGLATPNTCGLSTGACGLSSGACGFANNNACGLVNNACGAYPGTPLCSQALPQLPVAWVQNATCAQFSD